MFKIDEKPTFWTEVKVRLGDEEHVFRAQFCVRPSSKAKAAAEAKEEIEAFLLEYLCAWEDVLGADDDPLPFTPDNVIMLVDMPHVATALFRAYYEGLAGAQRGN